MMAELWIVGRYKQGEPGSIVWDFQGIFDSEAKAIAACRDWTYFVGPVTVNELLPHETSTNPRWDYPLADERGDGDGDDNSV